MDKRASHVVSANDLLSGGVIYLTRTDGWSQDLSEAAVAHNAVDAERLLGIASCQPDCAVGPYLVAVVATQGKITPTAFRERLRDTGPSIALPR